MGNSRKTRNRSSRGDESVSYTRPGYPSFSDERIFIVCEGSVTEPQYFLGLRRSCDLRAYQVQVEVDVPNPVKLVQIAQRAARSRRGRTIEFSQVWCVVDVEGPAPTAEFHRAVAVAREHNLHLAVSNPCFEYWYLLHFRETDQPFHNAEEVIRALRGQNCFPAYDKNCNAFEALADRTDLAIERAERLLKRHVGAEDFPNPSTTVFRLVRKIQDMSSGL